MYYRLLNNHKSQINFKGRLFVNFFSFECKLLPPLGFSMNLLPIWTNQTHFGPKSHSPVSVSDSVDDFGTRGVRIHGIKKNNNTKPMTLISIYKKSGNEYLIYNLLIYIKNANYVHCRHLGYCT